MSSTHGARQGQGQGQGQEQELAQSAVAAALLRAMEAEHEHGEDEDEDDDRDFTKDDHAGARAQGVGRQGTMRDRSSSVVSSSSPVDARTAVETNRSRSVSRVSRADVGFNAGQGHSLGDQSESEGHSRPGSGTAAAAHTSGSETGALRVMQDGVMTPPGSQRRLDSDFESSPHRQGITADGNPTVQGTYMGMGVGMAGGNVE